MSETVKLYGINKLRETLVVAESTRRSMQSNRSKDTKPELALRAALWQAGLRGYRKNVRSLPGTPDVVFGRARLAVFVHGCFWHGHGCGKAKTPTQNRAFWLAKVELNQQRHERHLAELAGRGYRTLTVWECELGSDPVAVLGRIKESLEAAV